MILNIIHVGVSWIMERPNNTACTESANLQSVELYATRKKNPVWRSRLCPSHIIIASRQVENSSLLGRSIEFGALDCSVLWIGPMCRLCRTIRFVVSDYRIRCVGFSSSFSDHWFGCVRLSSSFFRPTDFVVSDYRAHFGPLILLCQTFELSFFCQTTEVLESDYGVFCVGILSWLCLIMQNVC